MTIEASRALGRTALWAAAVLATLALAPERALAVHVSCGDTITENTTLDSDLVCFESGEAALTIGADRVRLDLGGHWIRTGIGRAVVNDGHDRVTIFNGRVSAAGTPILLRGADRNRLKDLTAFGGGAGVLLAGSDENRLVRNHFGGDDGGLLLTDGSDRNLITRNQLQGGLGGGLYIIDSDGNLATRNFGFGFPGSGSGLGVLSGSDNTTLQRNLVVQGGARDGILVAAETTGTFVVRNEVRGYLGDGIQVDSPFTTLTRNSSNDNGGWGILAVPGVTDGGGNTASGNVLGQCLNVSC